MNDHSQDADVVEKKQELDAARKELAELEELQKAEDAERLRLENSIRTRARRIDELTYLICKGGRN